MFQFNPIAILEMLAILLCWALAVVLYRVGTTGSVARKLSLLLVVEGFTLLSSGVWIDFLNPELQQKFFEPAAGSWMEMAGPVTFALHTLGDCVMLVLYPIFLASALQTRLTRPFADKRVQLALYGTAVALFFAVLLSPMEVGAVLLYGMLSLVFGYALVASVHAWTMAKPGLARTRAGVFTLAFGVRDICWGFVYGSAIYRIFTGVYMTEQDPEYVFLIYRLSTLVYIPILAYGILRTQLFDIDLRIRWTIKQSTVAGIFVSTIFVISEGASQFLSNELGNVVGLLAAGVLMFFLAPLQRFADRVAGAAMPNTKNTPEYVAFRKMQVYESAVSDALSEGGISPKERTLLNHLRNSLEISEADAEAIELELSTNLKFQNA